MTTKNGEKILYEDVSYAIRGACFDLYKQFGGVFKESIINKSLVKALENKGLKIKTQEKISVFYNNEKVGIYVPDLIVQDKVLIELKAKPFLIKEDDRQFWHYLKCSEYKLGFLINFGSRGLEIKRRVYDKARENIRVNPLLQNKYPRQSASINGQLLVESMVGVSIVLVGLLGIITVLSRSISFNRVISDQFIASYLAAEGIEITKNLLDENIIKENPWNQGFSDGNFEVDYDDTLDGENPGVKIGGADSVNSIYFNSATKLYSYASGGGNQTPFYRTVKIQQLNEGNEIQVNSTVKWTARNNENFEINLEDHFFNWYP